VNPDHRTPEFNIFAELGIHRREVYHSKFLAFILDPKGSHGHGQLFLKALLKDLVERAIQSGRPPAEFPLHPSEIDGIEIEEVRVVREQHHTDLLIDCRKPDGDLFSEHCSKPRLVVVIENKIEAPEEPGQLTRYEEAVSENYPDACPLYVYLTPSGDPPLNNPKWMTYRHQFIDDVFRRVRDQHQFAIGADVLLFLNHYLDVVPGKDPVETVEPFSLEEMREEEESMPRTAFGKSFGAGLARDSISVDQALLKLNALYDALDAEKRAILKSWIARLEPLQSIPLCSVRGAVRIRIEFNDFDVDELQPITILKAMESWERGEPYAPCLTDRGWA
jgi:PD-(D/E)XK nuclease superfamily